MKENIYSKERKALQKKGLLPKWMSTGGWQMYKQKYLHTDLSNLKEQYERISKTLAVHIGNNYPDWWEEYYSGKAWEEVFYKVLWDGDLSPSSPIHSNTGAGTGSPVSCSGGVVPDSVSGFYQARLETAVLTKEGFGCSSYLGGIRPRGASIGGGEIKASGTQPIFEMFVDDMKKICQGNQRRGAWAGSIEIDHPDFEEVCQYIQEVVDGINVGWLVGDSFIESLNAGDPKAVDTFCKALKTKMGVGKGYFTFIDKINRNRPEMYKDLGLFVLASNLCQEITLFSDLLHTFTCALSSLNLSNYDAWNPKLAFISAVFLDCVVEEFLNHAKDIPELEKAHRFTKKGRALGLGTMGLATLFQKRGIPFESFDAHMLNTKIYSDLNDESLEASQWLAEVLGEPEWCKGYGVRNTHRLAIAPTKSSSLIMGGVSEGINPDVAMTFTQTTSAGEIDRVNPVLLEIMKERGVYTKKHIQEITDDNGSVRNVSWLSDEEKKVYKTAFEMDMKNILRLASTRQKYIDQMQSLNLYFSGDEDEAYIGEVHKEAFLDPNILSLYYCYSRRGVAASKDSCEACQ